MTCPGGEPVVASCSYTTWVCSLPAGQRKQVRSLSRALEFQLRRKGVVVWHQTDRLARLEASLFGSWILWITKMMVETGDQGGTKLINYWCKIWGITAEGFSDGWITLQVWILVCLPSSLLPRLYSSLACKLFWVLFSKA